MKAMVIYEHGGPEVLKWAELPAPQPGMGEVCVRVSACSVNHLDIWVRKGLPNLKLTYPHILGCDVVGTVESIGEGVKNIQKGQKVVVAPGVSCGSCERCLSGEDNLCRQYGILGEHRWGGYAEFITVPASNILPYPEGFTPEELASIPLVFLTAWQMVMDKAKVQPGETVLVMAGASGVGTAAIQICKLLGTRIITTASSEGKLKKLKELGAEFTVNYSEENWEKKILQFTDGKGVDVVIDHTGTDFWEKIIRLTRWGGKIVLCGATSGYLAQTDLRHIFYRQLSIFGSTMGKKASLHQILRLVEEKKLRPIVDEVFPLHQAQEAHRKLESRSVFGKVVLSLSHL
ncbi:MAG: zinc-binding dehydrogenase [bacterium JZ-2024 1]